MLAGDAERTFRHWRGRIRPYGLKYLAASLFDRFCREETVAPLRVLLDDNFRIEEDRSMTIANASIQRRKAPTRSRTASIKLPDPLPAAVMQATLPASDGDGASDEQASVQERLAELEALIHSGFRQYKEIGRHLDEIRVDKLWRFEGDASFDAYCHRVFGFGDKRASQLIVAGKSSTSGRNERQVRNRESAPVEFCSWCETRVPVKRPKSSLAAVEALALSGPTVGGVAQFVPGEEATAAFIEGVETLAELRRLVDDPERELPGVDPEARERIGQAITAMTDRLLHELHGITRVPV